MDQNALPKGATPLPDRFKTTSCDIGISNISKDKLDPAIFAYYDAKIAHLEKLVGQLYYPHNPHV